MSRRASAPTRTILPDPRFNSLLLAKFVNMVMDSGKKSVAEMIVYGAVDRITEKTGKAADQSIELLAQALDNVKPTVEVKSRRVGGATYQVPVEVRTARRQTLAMRWVIEAAVARSEKSMAQRLAAELLDASENRGAAVRKREDTHRMAEANKAFAHYRWKASCRLLANSRGPHRVTHHAHRPLPEYRYFGAYRCGQDDDDRADPVLHGRIAQDRRGP